MQLVITMIRYLRYMYAVAKSHAECQLKARRVDVVKSIKRSYASKRCFALKTGHATNFGKAGLDTLSRAPLAPHLHSCGLARRLDCL